MNGYLVVGGSVGNRRVARHPTVEPWADTLEDRRTGSMHRPIRTDQRTRVADVRARFFAATPPAV